MVADSTVSGHGFDPHRRIKLKDYSPDKISVPARTLRFGFCRTIHASFMEAQDVLTQLWNE